MEFLIHDRSQKTREAVKNGTETAFGLEVAEAKNEIFTCRLKNRGFEV